MIGAGVRARLAGKGGRAAIGSVLAGGSLQLVAVATGIIAARLLGVDDRGRLALLWVVTLLAGQLGTLGLHTSVAYAIAAGEAPRHVLARLRPVILWMLAGTPLVQLGVLLLVVGDWPSGMPVAAASTLAVAPVLVLWLIALGVAQGTQRYGALQRHRVVQPLLYVAGLAAFAIAGGDDLAPITAAWSLTMVVSGAFAWRDCTGGWGLPQPGGGEHEPVLGTSREMVSFGVRGMLGTFGASEHLMLDQLLVGIFLPARELGLYVVAMAFANLPRFLGQSVGYVAYPQVAAAEPEARRRVLVRYLSFTLALLVPAGAILLAVSGAALPVVFGDEFQEATPVATILIVAALVQAVRRVLTEASRGLGSGAPGAISEAIFIVVLVAAAIPLMDADGARGAAVAVLIAAVVGLGTLVVLVVAGRTETAASRLPLRLN